MQKKNFIVCVLSAFLISISFMMVFKNSFKFAKAEEEIDNYQSKCCYLIEPDSGTVICAKNENEKRPIASMCKIMTLLLIFDEIDAGNLKLDQEITVSETASGMGGSQVFLEAGGVYKISDLIKSIVVASANDACVALAEQIAGSESVFVEKMNNKCKEIGMENTVFVNCTGLPKLGQHSTAKDVAIMFSKLITHKEYFGFSNVWMDKIYHSNDRYTEISNTNKLIKFYNGCDSGKTGFTQEAGHCLCASAIRNNTRLISVVINAPDSKTRFNDVSKMFNYGFANYVNKIVVDKDQNVYNDVPVKYGKNDFLTAKPEKSIFIFSEKNVERIIDVKVSYFENLKAPINIGEKVGKIQIFENNVLIKETYLISTELVKKSNYFDNIKEIVQNWVI